MTKQVAKRKGPIPDDDDQLELAVRQARTGREVMAHVTKYFVMLSLANGDPTPMVNFDEEGDPALYDTEEEACEAAKRNPLGEAYHFEVYAWSRRVEEEQS